MGGQAKKGVGKLSMLSRGRRVGRTKEIIYSELNSRAIARSPITRPKQRAVGMAPPERPSRAESARKRAQETRSQVASSAESSARFLAPLAPRSARVSVQR